MAETKGLKLLDMGGQDGAPDLLLLHGFGADRYAWTATTPAFEASHRLWAAELPGHGGNASHPATTPTEMATAIAEAMDDAISRPVSVVAHSLGATVAIELVRQRPDLIDTAVLIAPLGLGGAVSESFLTGFAELSSQEEAQAHLRLLVQRPRLIAPQMADHVLQFLSQERHREALRKIARAVLEVGDIEVPAGLNPSLIWGEADGINPLDTVRLNGLGLSAHVLPDTGHLPQMEAIRQTNAFIAQALEGG